MPQVFSPQELADIKSFYKKKRMKQMADALEQYLDMADKYIIFDLEEDEYKDAVKTVKKLIKHLKKGEWEKCYVPDIEKELTDIGYHLPGREGDGSYPF